MPEIAAENSLLIRYDESRWGLFRTSATSDVSLLLSAYPDAVTYPPEFAAARHLPPAGKLPSEEIVMVVVGWASEDQSWHLGLLLAPDVAQARGGRWCGLARWAEAEGNAAEAAGRALAALIGRSFRLVPPPDQEPPPGTPTIDKRDTLIDYAQAEVSAVPPVLPLPIELGEWVFSEDSQGLIVQHTAAWRRALISRALFYFALVPVFGLLSFGALFSQYAPVQPEWLPYVGIGVTLFVFALGLSQIQPVLQGPITTIDRRARLLRQTARSGARVLVQSPFEGLQYALVSHVINRRKRIDNTENGFDDFAAEVWLHVFSPRRSFIRVFQVSEVEGRIRRDLEVNGRRPLDLSEIDSPAHQAALYAAHEIGIPVYIEER